MVDVKKREPLRSTAKNITKAFRVFCFLNVEVTAWYRIGSYTKKSYEKLLV